MNAFRGETAAKAELEGKMSEREIKLRLAALVCANEAIDRLKKIGPNNPYRNRAFEVVSEFMKSNGAE